MNPHMFADGRSTPDLQMCSRLAGTLPGAASERAEVRRDGVPLGAKS